MSTILIDGNWFDVIPAARGFYALQLAPVINGEPSVAQHVTKDAVIAWAIRDGIEKMYSISLFLGVTNSPILNASNGSVVEQGQAQYININIWFEAALKARKLIEEPGAKS